MKHFAVFSDIEKIINRLIHSGKESFICRSARPTFDLVLAGSLQKKSIQTALSMFYLVDSQV